jgi:hypothetical protein
MHANNLCYQILGRQLCVVYTSFHLVLCIGLVVETSKCKVLAAACLWVMKAYLYTWKCMYYLKEVSINHVVVVSELDRYCVREGRQVSIHYLSSSEYSSYTSSTSQCDFHHRCTSCFVW